jgi:hypothetical protein
MSFWFFLALLWLSETTAAPSIRIALCISQLPRTTSDGGRDLNDFEWPWSGVSFFRNDSDIETSLFIYHQLAANLFDSTRVNDILTRVASLNPTRVVVGVAPSREELFQWISPGLNATNMYEFASYGTPQEVHVGVVRGRRSALNEAHLRWRVFQIVRQYESDHQFSFTHVVNLRSELRFWLPPPRLRDLAARPHTLWTQGNNGYGGVNSNFAFMSRSIADSFMAQGLDELSSGKMTAVGRSFVMSQSAEEQVLMSVRAATTPNSHLWSVCHMPTVAALQCCDQAAAAAIGEICSWSGACFASVEVKLEWSERVDKFLSQLDLAHLRVAAGAVGHAKQAGVRGVVGQNFLDPAVWQLLIDGATVSCNAAAGTQMLAADYVVVGSGSGGMSAAEALSRRKQSVIVVEAGSSREEFGRSGVLERIERLRVLPGESGQPLAESLFWDTELQTKLPGQLLKFTAGKFVGGSGVLSSTALAAGTRASFDRWPSGWQFQDVQAELQSMLSTWPHSRQASATLDRLVDNSTGCNVLDAALQVCPHRELRVGAQSGTESGTLARSTLSADRCSVLLTNGAARATLDRLLKRFPNRLCRGDAYNVLLAPRVEKSGSPLKRLQKSIVRRIVWQHDLDAEVITGRPRVQLGAEGAKAVGVLYAIEGATSYSAYVGARRGVVLASGAVGTPGVLFRSGIGQSAEMAVVGIKPVYVQPNLGQFLTDHTRGAIQCALHEPGAFADRLSNLLMIGATMDDRIVLRVESNK